MSELISLGFFFAMRSCEFYMEKGEHKTKIVAVGGAQCFKKNNQTMPQTSRCTFTAFGISIMFVVQKNECLWDTMS